MKIRYFPLGVALSLSLAWSLAARAYPERASSLRADAAKTHIGYLASPELAGRGSGEKGNEKAARYIAAEFKRVGLKPVGTARQNEAGAQADGRGYFQPFPFTAGVAKGKLNSLEALRDGKKIRYNAGTEFEPSGVSGTGKASGEVVFAGFGIDSADPMRNDYAGQEVSGKIVLILAGSPDNDPHSPLEKYAGIRAKALIARNKGVAALVVVLPRDTDAPRLNSDGSGADAGLPILVVRRSVASEWLRAAGKNLNDIETTLAKNPQAFPLNVTVSLSADVKKVTKTSANIAGLLEGSDPTLREEVVVIGAHMDHLGMGGPHSLAENKKPAIHHGADDNASGTAGVLMLADYFANLSPRPKRSLLFLCFSGEELGLLGSAHYVKNPLLPLNKTVAMLNMDMIGRMTNNRLIVIGSGTSPSWASLLDEVNKAANFTLSKSESGFGASDQQSFYVSKIPVLMFFTGLHGDYHRPSDTTEKINAYDQARVVEFVAECARRIAALPERPAYAQITTTESAPAARFRVSLGSIPDYAAEVEGVMLSGVRPGSPADKAGLKQGDIIIKFGDRAIRNVQEYTIALSEHKPGDVVKIVIKRSGETLTVTATLVESRR